MRRLRARGLRWRWGEARGAYLESTLGSLRFFNAGWQEAVHFFTRRIRFVLASARLIHLFRALFAATATLIAGIVECVTGRAVPAAVSLPLLVVVFAAIRTFRSSDPAAPATEPFGFGAMVLPVFGFAAWVLGGHD